MAMGPDQKSSRRALTLSLPIFAFLLSILAVIGWLVWNEPLASFMAPYTSFNSAWCLAIMSIAVFMSERDFGYSPIIAVPPIVFSFLTLSEQAANKDFGIDQLFFRMMSHEDGMPPGRMSVTTALCVVLLGSALFYECRGLTHRTCIAISLILSAMAAIQYVIFLSVSDMTLNGATILVLLSVSMAKHSFVDEP